MSEPRFVEAGELRFAYFEEGEGPLVLMLHGFPDTAHTWDEVRPRVAARGYRVVTPFMRGYHPTQIPESGRYDSDTLGKDVLALIEALSPGEAAIVVGHDWGASAAFSAVGLEPERISKLITAAVPHPASLKPTPKLLWTVRHFFALNLPGAAARLRANDFAGLDELVQRWSPSWNVPAEETARIKQTFSQPGSLEAAVGYYRALSPVLPKSQRRRVRVPSAAIAGSDDIMPVSAYHAAERRYTDDYRVFEVPGGHFMHREHPEPFIRALLEALD